MNATNYIPVLGTQWRNRNGRLCTVIDVYTTRNNAGDVVKVEYLSKHDFCGSRVEHLDSQVTIGRGMARHLTERTA